MPEYTDLLVSMEQWSEQKSYLIRDMTKNLVDGKKGGTTSGKKPDGKSGTDSRGFFVVR